MKIFDCFMYFDEEIVLDLRLNILNKYVDYFVIVESTFTHKGEKRQLLFNHKKFSKFKDKIIFSVVLFNSRFSRFKISYTSVIKIIFSTLALFYS